MTPKATRANRYIIRLFDNGGLFGSFTHRKRVQSLSDRCKKAFSMSAVIAYFRFQNRIKRSDVFRRLVGPRYMLYLDC